MWFKNPSPIRLHADLTCYLVIRAYQSCQVWLRIDSFRRHSQKQKCLMFLEVSLAQCSASDEHAYAASKATNRELRGMH